LAAIVANGHACQRWLLADPPSLERARLSAERIIRDANAAAEVLFGPGSEFKWSAIQATAHAIMAIPTQNNVKPYAKVGAGLYNVGLKLDTPTSGSSSDSKSEFGFNVGGGFNVLTHSNMTWGLSGAYHMVQAKNDLGSDVNFFQVGVDVLWGSR